MLDPSIPIVTRAAFEVSAIEGGDTLKIRTALLTALPIVGVPVASAILALVMPEEYGVVDFRGWHQVFSEKRGSFSIKDYSRYMIHLWRLSDELQWLPQEVDHAIWEYDRRTKQGRTPNVLRVATDCFTNERESGVQVSRVPRAIS